MKMNKSRKVSLNFYTFFIVLMVSLSAGVFLVFPVTLETWRSVLALVAISFLVIHLFVRKPRESMPRFLKWYMAIYTIIICIGIINATVRYNYTMYEVFYSLREYIVLLVTIPVARWVIKTRSIDSFLKVVISITLISLIIRTITWFCDTMFHFVLFHSVLYEYGGSWARNGISRIDATPLICILVVGLYYFYLKNHDFKYIVLLGFVFLYLLIITQTRTLILSSMFAVLVMFFFKKRSPNSSKLVKIIMYLLIIIFLIIGGAAKIKDYFGLSSGLVGLDYRYYEFKYFFGLLTNGNWRLGLGILNNINSNSGVILFGNMNTKMYLDDLGFFESFIQFGSLSLILQIPVFYYLFKISRRCWKNHAYVERLLLLGLLGYLLASFIPLDIFGIQRSFAIMVILVIAAYFDWMTARNMNSN